MVDTAYTQIAYSPQETAKDASKPDASGNSEFSFFGEDGFSFLDFVDMINPLQHIPVVSTAYREMTGDELDPGSRLAGGTLFGGPIGLAASAFNVILEHNTGKDAGEHVVAWFDGEEAPVDDTMLAKNDQNPAVASFAPVIPDSEADAFAAGEASLRMAELQEFMSPGASVQEVTPQVQNNPKGAGSAGTWSPPLNVDHPFPTERPLNPQDTTVSSFYQAQPALNVAQAETVSNSKQAFGFKAKASHEDSIDALRAYAQDNQMPPVQQAVRQPASAPTSQDNPIEQNSLSALQAFARDVQAQRQAETARQALNTPEHPPVTTTSQLNQTNDNAWFANMMSQNMDRYGRPDVKG